MARPLSHAAQGAPAPALHRRDAPFHPGGPRPRARRAPARGAGRRVAAPAAGHRRAGLVPVPAALRHRPVGGPHRGRRSPAAGRGRGGRAGRGIGLAGDPGRPLGLRGQVRRADPDGGTDPGRGRGGLRRHRDRHRPDHRGQPDRHPLDARTLARLAAAYAGRGVVGFGLSNDERRGAAHDFAPAFRIAARGGLVAVPHGGELAGPGQRPGLPGRAARRPDRPRGRRRPGPALARNGSPRPASPWRYARRPTWRSGSPPRPPTCPLRTLLDAGIAVALGADDPLLFGRRLTAQYQIARQAHGLCDDELAELARMSVRGSVAPEEVRARLLAGIDAWLAAPALPRAAQLSRSASPWPGLD